MNRPAISQASQDAINSIRAKMPDGATMVFVSGNFNIVHPGHLRVLRFAAENGDFLVVGVHNNSNGGVSLDEELRLEGVLANSWVNAAFILRDSVADIIAHLRPSLVVKGKEHETSVNQERAVLDSYGGRLLFSSGDLAFSSLDLLQKELANTHGPTIEQPLAYLRRHGLTRGRLEKCLDRVQGLKAIVIGDMIVDEYIACEPLGMSQEDPTIVVTPLHSERFIGGAGIVAAHAAAMGVDVSFYTVVGEDETADFVQEELTRCGVRNRFYTDTSRPTTVKQRFRANNKTLLRVNQLRQHGISREVQSRISKDVIAELAEADLIIFADFNYGVLPQPLIETIAAAAASSGVMAVADSQSSSQIGNVARYRGMDLLTPTEREARLAVQDYSSGLAVLADALMQQSQARNIFITLGKEGALVHTPDGEEQEWNTDRLPALNSAPRDVAGAGDSLLTLSSLVLCAGGNIWEAAYLGCLAAGCQVSQIGNRPLSLNSVRKYVSTLPGSYPESSTDG